MAPNEHIMAVVVDLSPSFAERFDHEDGAYKWILNVVSNYSREFPGKEGRLIIGQMSAGPDSDVLLWEGRPAHLKRSFSSPDEFKLFLQAQSQGAGGTPVYESLGDTLDFLLRHPTVRSGQSGVDLLVVSDMVDNMDDGTQRERVSELLKQFSAQGSTCGMYYLDISVVPEVEQLLHESGYPNAGFTTLIDRFPEIPAFNVRY